MICSPDLPYLLDMPCRGSENESKFLWQLISSGLDFNLERPVNLPCFQRVRGRRRALVRIKALVLAAQEPGSRFGEPSFIDAGDAVKFAIIVASIWAGADRSSTRPVPGGILCRNTRIVSREMSRYLISAGASV